MKRITTYAIASLIALVLGSSYLLDGPDDIKTARLTAQAVAALPAQHQAMRVTR